MVTVTETLFVSTDEQIAKKLAEAEDNARPLGPLQSVTMCEQRVALDGPLAAGDNQRGMQ